MNPNIKKKFLLDAWDYNASLDKPFLVSYDSPTSYYMKHNYLLFKSELENKITIKKDYYNSLIEKEIAAEISNSSQRKLTLNADNNFIEPYFTHFFKNNTSLQLDLLKFFYELLNHNFKIFNFLEKFEKKEIEPFLSNINHWQSYNSKSLIDLHTLMIEKNFNEGFRVSILKKYVENNLKVINKKPELSKSLEEFLTQYYYNSFDIITSNVVAIQNRLKPVDEERYLSSFNKDTVSCITDNIKFDNLLKTFQISGWTHDSYRRVVSNYHIHITKQNNFKIKEIISENQKELNFFITMKNSDYSLDTYKKDLFVLINFYRNNHNYVINDEHISKILFNQKLNDSLNGEKKKEKSLKI